MSVSYEEPHHRLQVCVRCGRVYVFVYVYICAFAYQCAYTQQDKKVTRNSTGQASHKQED